MPARRLINGHQPELFLKRQRRVDPSTLAPVPQEVTAVRAGSFGRVTYEVQGGAACCWAAVQGAPAGVYACTEGVESSRARTLGGRQESLGSAAQAFSPQ